MVNVDAIPAELRGRKQWVVWKYKTIDEGYPEGFQLESEKKKTKVLYNPFFPSNKSSSTDSDKWSDFNLAMFVYKNERFDGIGFVFSNIDPYIGIDFDHCFNSDGILKPQWNEYVERFDSYTEISPSGKGLHIICKGKYPFDDLKGKHKGNVEMYCNSRFFTITGNVYNNKTEIKEVAVPKLLYLAETELKTVTPQTTRSTFIPTSTDLSDTEIVTKASNAKNSSKFVQLWRGNISGYTSQSEAELALVSLLAFYTTDANQIYRMMTQSGLHREKHKRDDYMNNTILKGMNGVNEHYDPNKLKEESIKRGTLIFKELGVI